RAAFFKEYADKRLKHIIQSTSAAFGSAATRLDAFVAAGGLFTYGTYPDIEGLIREQSTELDRGKREAILHRIQQLMHEKVMYAPLLELAIPGGDGPRAAESAHRLIPEQAGSAPHEGLRLKGEGPSPSAASAETRSPCPFSAARPDESRPTRTARAGALPSAGRRRRARSRARSRVGQRPAWPSRRRRNRASSTGPRDTRDSPCWRTLWC